MGAERPFQIGLTGGIGSGKSVVARIFGMLGAPVYESDAEAKKIYQNPEIRQEVESLFGPKAYRSDGLPDASFLAAAIYNDPDLREKLNGILHPAVAVHYHRWLEQQTFPYVLKVAALIFEADIARQMDYCLLVVSPEALKEQRVARRDPFRPKEQIRKIVESQWSDARKIPLSDGLVHNDENHSLVLQVWEYHHRFLTLASRP